jgi:hypothetical protein
MCVSSCLPECNAEIEFFSLECVLFTSYRVDVCFLVALLPGFNVDNVHETYLMKLPEDDPKCGLKHVTVIKPT